MASEYGVSAGCPASEVSKEAKCHGELVSSDGDGESASQAIL